LRGDKIFGLIIYIITRMIYLSASKTYHIKGTLPTSSYIHTMWHRNLLFQPIIYKHLHLKSKLFAFISRSRDGSIIAYIYKLFGIDAIRGSSSKGAAKALLEAIKLLKNNNSIIITPDGPRGPIYSLADGVYQMSYKSNSPILLSSVVASRYWSFNSWDRFVLPKPFCHLDIYLETINVSHYNKNEANKIIKNGLMKYVF